MSRLRSTAEGFVSAAAALTLSAALSLSPWGNSFARQRVDALDEEKPGQGIPPFSDISFGRNNATVGESAAATLDGAAIELQNNPALRIIIDGHSDLAESSGIALRRAEVERAYLVHARGISPERVVVRRFDHRCPKEGPHANRRAELYLLPQGSPITSIRKECGGGPQRSNPGEAPRLSPFVKKDVTADRPPMLVAQVGHAARVRAVAFSPDGRAALTGADDSTAILWDVATGAKLQEFAGHSGAVNDVALSPDGSLVLSAGNDGTARIWERSAGVEVLRLTGHAGRVTSAAFSPDGRLVATGGEDSTARLWDARTGRELQRLKTDYVVDVAFSAEGASLLTADAARNLILWSPQTGGEVRRLRAPHPLTYAAFSPNGKLLMAVGDHHVGLWDAASGAEVGKFSSDPSQILSAGFSPDGRLLALGGVGSLGFRDVADARRPRASGSLPGAAEALAFSPDGTSILAGGGDGVALLINVADGSVKRRFEGSGESVNAVSITEDSLVFGLKSGVVSLWGRSTGRERRRLSLRPYEAFEVAVSPDGRLVRAVGISPGGAYQTDWDGDGGVSRLWLVGGRELRLRESVYEAGDRKDALFRRRRFYLTGDGGFIQADQPMPFVLRSPDTGRRVRTFRGRSAALSEDDGRVLVGHPGGRVLLHEAATGRVVRRFSAGSAGVNAVGFSPDGRLIWAIDDDGHAFMWDASSATPLWRQQIDARHLFFMQFSPDARRVAVESRTTHTTRVSVLDTSSGKELWHYDEEQHGETLTFSPEGRFALRTVDYPRYSGASARLVDALTGAVLWATEDFGARFSPDGRFVLSQLLGGGLRLREAATGRELWRFMRGRTAGAVSPDGRLILVGAENGAAWLLDAQTGGEVARVVFFRGGGWAVIDPDGRYYDASARKDIPGLIGVVNERPVRLPELKGEVRVPGLLTRLLVPRAGLKRSPG